MITDIHTTCSCTGMERKEGDRYVRLDSVRLKGGQETSLFMRVSVRGVPVGSQMITGVEFDTNDPAHPVGKIAAVVRAVSGGVYAAPQSVVFGVVSVGTEVRRVIEVRDIAPKKRKVERIVSLHPDRVAVALIPATDTSDQLCKDMDTSIIARLEAHVNTEFAGEVNVPIEIYLAEEGSRLDPVSVVGKVIEPVVMAPAAIALPRTSRDGPIYSATCIIRSTNGKAITIAVEAVPLGIAVDLENHEPSCTHAMTVRISPDAIPRLSDHKNIVVLKAIDNGIARRLELPVLLHK